MNRMQIRKKRSNTSGRQMFVWNLDVFWWAGLSLVREKYCNAMIPLTLTGTILQLCDC